jgi:hypothetical protein
VAEVSAVIISVNVVTITHKATIPPGAAHGSLEPVKATEAVPLRFASVAL